MEEPDYGMGLSAGFNPHSDWCGCPSCSPQSYSDERLRKENEELKVQIETLKKERDALKAWIPFEKATPAKQSYYIHFQKYTQEVSQRFREYVRDNEKEIEIIGTAPAGPSAYVEATQNAIEKMTAHTTREALHIKSVTPGGGDSLLMEDSLF